MTKDEASESIFEAMTIRSQRGVWSLVFLILLCTGLPLRSQSNWTTGTTGTGKQLASVAWNGALYVAVGEDGAVVSSTNGASWTARVSATTQSLRSVVFGGGQFVAVGASGTVVTSPDGLSWSARTTPVGVSEKVLSGVAYGNGRYVAVGGSGVIVHSTDGQTWVETTSPLAFFLQGVTFGGGRFVAVGVSGTIIHSDDGIAWTGATGSGGAFLTGVTFASGQYVAVGQSGTILTSPSGENWTARTSGTASWLRTVNYFAGLYVTGGDAGAILASRDGVFWEAQTSGVVEAFFGSVAGVPDLVLVGGRVAPGDPGLTSRVIRSAHVLDSGFRWNLASGNVLETGGQALLEIERVGPLSASAEVSWTPLSGTATAGEDFEGSPGSEVFAVGESLRQIAVTVNDDALLEGSESFSVRLGLVTPGHVIHAPIDATVEIGDDEDSDGDGLPDAWEIMHYGVVTSVDGASDSDGDGLNSARELADGTSPTDAQSAAYRLTLPSVTGGGVQAVPAQSAYAPGAQVVLTPFADPLFTFLDWAPPFAGGASPLTVTMTADTTVSPYFRLPLTAALDSAGIDWFTGSAGIDWFGQTAVSADGVDAAKVDGNAMNGGDTGLLETTVDGPATLTFSWKISAGAGTDFLRFEVDSFEVHSITGEEDWASVTVEIEPGRHFLAWRFDRGFSVPEGQNAAWLDLVGISSPFESWLAWFFSPAERAIPEIGGPEGDPDGDGRGNFLEYALGLHPLTATDIANRAEALVGSSDGMGGGAIGLRFQRRLASSPFVDYELERSTDLMSQNWVPIAATEEVESTTDTVQVVLLRDLSPPSIRSFYRLRANLVVP